MLAQLQKKHKDQNIRITESTAIYLKCQHSVTMYIIIFVKRISSAKRQKESSAILFVHRMPIHFVRITFSFTILSELARIPRPTMSISFLAEFFFF